MTDAELSYTWVERMNPGERVTRTRQSQETVSARTTSTLRPDFYQVSAQVSCLPGPDTAA